MLPTCSSQLRRQLGSSIHHVIVSILSETVIAIIVHVVIVVVIINTDGSSGDSARKNLLSLILLCWKEGQAYLLTIMPVEVTTDVRPLDRVMV